MEENQENKQNDEPEVLQTNDVKQQPTDSTEQDLLDQIEGKKPKNEPTFETEQTEIEQTAENEQAAEVDGQANPNIKVVNTASGLDVIDENDGVIRDDRFEKASYNEREYQRIAKIRTRGKMYRVDVPYLQFPLTKPEKPRKFFTFLGVLFAIMTGLVAAFTAMVAFSVVIPMITISAGGLSEISDVTKAIDVLGLVAAFNTLTLGFVIAIGIGILGLLAGAIYYFVQQSKLFFYLAKANREEVAQGPLIFQIILSAGIWLAVSIAIIIFVIIRTGNDSMVPGLIGLAVFVVLAIVVGMAFFGVIAEMFKERKFFKTLPEDQQKSYKEYSRRLRHVRDKQQESQRTSAGPLSRNSTSSGKLNIFFAILDFIAKVADDTMIYKNIKENPDLKAISNHFGVKAIWHSVLFTVFGLIAAFIWLQIFNGIGVILTILGAILGIGLAFYAVEFFIFAFAYVIKQLKLNRRAISWFALIVFILCTILLGFLLSMVMSTGAKVL